MQTLASAAQALPAAGAAPARYGRVASALHGLLAVGLFAQLALGLWMVELPKAPVGLRASWFNLHKSIGMCLALLVLLRLLWRLSHAVPGPVAGAPRWQALAAQLNHGLLYLCMLLMPVSGFLGSSFSAYPIKFFGIPLPRLWEASAPFKDWCSAVHEWAAEVFVAALALHILAALWHQWVRGDAIFQRINPWGGTRS